MLSYRDINKVLLLTRVTHPLDVRVANRRMIKEVNCNEFVALGDEEGMGRSQLSRLPYMAICPD